MFKVMSIALRPLWSLTVFLSYFAPTSLRPDTEVQSSACNLLIYDWKKYFAFISIFLFVKYL